MSESRSNGLKTAADRRYSLRLLSGGALLAATSGAHALCRASPPQTEGPFYLREVAARVDLRGDRVSGRQSAGVPLLLELLVSRGGAEGCSPLAGVRVDVWHCDAHGAYSAVSGWRALAGRADFLRGYQLSDAAGAVRFRSIYPGWYPGRAVHIHVKVSGGPIAAGSDFTTQLYFDDALTDRVHADPAYGKRSGKRTTNAQDGIYRHGGDRLLLAPEEREDGLVARFELVVEHPTG
jgi:protocatechuate 3,4-dioxygenase beta subunit